MKINAGSAGAKLPESGRDSAEQLLGTTRSAPENPGPESLHERNSSSALRIEDDFQPEELVRALLKVESSSEKQEPRKRARICGLVNPLLTSLLLGTIFIGLVIVSLYVSAPTRRSQDYHENPLLANYRFTPSFLDIGRGFFNWDISKTERQNDDFYDSDEEYDYPLDACWDIPDAMKFDCFPQGGAGETECLRRGCCWAPVNSDSVPFCFYPAGYATYQFVNVTEHEDREGHLHQVEAFMKQTHPSGYPEDIQLLKLIATFETVNRLHVKIVDAEHPRYEVTVLPTIEQYDDDSSGQGFDPLYEFSIDEKKLGFRVIRKSTGEVLFDCAGVGGFTYANQFLQLSALLPSSYVYGLGEHQDSFVLSFNWQRYALMAHDVIPSKGKNLYGAHPFYLAMENDGNSHGVFLKNSDPMDVVLQPAPAVTFRPIGGVLDFYFFLGPSPKEVIEQYTEVIGRPFFPPYWGLGFHLCRYNYGSLNRTKEVWDRTRAADIPFDVQWNDLDYMDTSKDFTYDENRFQGLPEFVKGLHHVGMHYIPLIDPGISNAEGEGYVPYDDGVRMNVFIKESMESKEPFVGKVWNPVSTVWPDFTHPNATEYWTKQLKFFYDQVPIDGAWIDMNEPSNFYSGTAHGCPNTKWDNPPYVPNVDGGILYFRTVCMSAGQHLSRHYDVHNIYGLTETVATEFALKQIRGRRPFIISRSTFPGQGRYGGHWSGDVQSDWENMRMSVTSVLNYNLYGTPLIGADICGFNGNTTAALCRRWMQLGAFYPFSRNHNTDDAIDQDPVALGPEVVDASRKALNIRYTLLPYLYTLFWKAHVLGHTVARPLFFEFPRDRETLTISSQFLWGSSLMIVPVLEDQKVSVSAYFPAARWYNYHTRLLESSGEEWKVLDAPLDTIPLLIRGGHILPTQDPAATTVLSRQNPFKLLAALDDKGLAHGSLYWDDGDTIDAFEVGVYNFLEFNITSGRFQSDPRHWRYTAETIKLDEIAVLGMENPVNDVHVNGFPYDSYEYDAVTKVFIIHKLNLDLSHPISVTWK